MKRKTKLLILFQTLFICVCVLTIGVWASKQAELKTGGTISFVADGVNVKVSGVITGQQGDNIDLPEVGYSTKSTNPDTSEWQGHILNFKEDASTIQYQLIVENLADRELYVKVINNEVIENLSITTSGDEVVDSVLAFTGKGTKTININFDPTNPNVSIETSNYDISIILSATEFLVVGPEDIYTETFNEGTESEYTEHYINMGKYPQTLVEESEMPASLVADKNGTTYNTGETIEGFAVKKDSDTNKEYVYDSKKSKWFEIKPVKWLILGYYDSQDIYHGRNTAEGIEDTTFNPAQYGVKLQLISEQIISTTYFREIECDDVDPSLQENISVISNNLKNFLSTLKTVMFSSNTAVLNQVNKTVGNDNGTGDQANINDTSKWMEHFNEILGNNVYNGFVSEHQKTNVDGYNLWCLSLNEIDNMQNFSSNDSRKATESDWAAREPTLSGMNDSYYHNCYALRSIGDECYGNGYSLLGVASDGSYGKVSTNYSQPTSGYSCGIRPAMLFVI